MSNDDENQLLTNQEKAELLIGTILLTLAFGVVGWVWCETHSIPIF